MGNEIETYYEGYDENGRLQRDNAHKVEFLTTVHYFDRVFGKNSRILDVCAGAGAYAFHLAANGHIVTACDLVAHHVHIMQSNQDAKMLKEIRVCNVLDLSCFQPESFDVVLCMGALYHLKSEADRKKAVVECMRVLKPGGWLVLAYLNKFACIAANVNMGLTNIDEAMAVYHGQDDFVFTTTTPESMAKLTEGCGLETVHRVGADGMVYVLSDKLNAADDKNFQTWMEYHIATCEEPSILGSSMHGLELCRK